MSWKTTIKLFENGHIYTEPDFCADNEAEILHIDTKYCEEDFEIDTDTEIGQYLLKVIRFYEANK